MALTFIHILKYVCVFVFVGSYGFIIIFIVKNSEGRNYSADSDFK